MERKTWAQAGKAAQRANPLSPPPPRWGGSQQGVAIEVGRGETPRLYPKEDEEWKWAQKKLWGCLRRIPLPSEMEGVCSLLGLFLYEHICR